MTNRIFITDIAPEQFKQSLIVAVYKLDCNLEYRKTFAKIFGKRLKIVE